MLLIAAGRRVPVTPHTTALLASALVEAGQIIAAYERDLKRREPKKKPGP